MKFCDAETCRIRSIWFIKMAAEVEDWFINASLVFQNNLTKIYNARNHIYGENFKLKLCTCAQSMAFGTHRVSAWNFHKKYEFCNAHISRE